MLHKVKLWRKTHKVRLINELKVPKNRMRLLHQRIIKSLQPRKNIQSIDRTVVFLLLVLLPFWLRWEECLHPSTSKAVFKVELMVKSVLWMAFTSCGRQHIAKAIILTASWYLSGHWYSTSNNIKHAWSHARSVYW